MKNKKLTGYPSIDKPWLKYYSEEAINAPLPECTIYEYLWENNKDNLDDTALIYFGRKITYKELFEDIDKAARSFSAIGVKPRDVCTVISLSCINSIIIFYALNKIGAISNYISVIASETEFKSYFNDAKSKYIVTMDLFADKVITASRKIGVKKIISFSLSDYMPYRIKLGYKIKMPKIDTHFFTLQHVIQWSDFLKLSDTVVNNKCKHDCNSISIWAHTGGTTGFPKTVLLTDKAYNSVAMQYMKSMPHSRKDVFLNIMPPFIVYGMLTCMHMPLCLGITIAIIPKFEAENWRKYIENYKPNHIAGIPSYFIPMLHDEKLKKIDLSCVNTLAAGGDGLNEKLENDLNMFLSQHGSNAKLIKGYGMTEVCSSAITAFGDYSKIGSVGIPLVKNNIKIYDNDNMSECQYNKTGEILLSSPSLMVGYKDNEKETGDLIITDDDEAKWVHTGDLGFVDEQGFLFLIGRMKRFIFVGPEGLPYKVFPKKIEDVIISITCISEVCVVSTNTENGFAPIAYIVLKKEILRSENEVIEIIKNTCQKQLPNYLQPFDYKFLNDLPKTAIGKIDYRALEKLAENNFKN